MILVQWIRILWWVSEDVKLVMSFIVAIQKFFWVVLILAIILHFLWSRIGLERMNDIEKNFS